MMSRLSLTIFLVVILASCGSDERTKGDVLFTEGKYAASVKAYNEYIGLHPTHIKSIYNRGRAFEELKDYTKAFDDFMYVLKIDKKNTSALLSLSKFYYRDAEYDQSKYYAQSAIKINDQLPQAYFWKGRTLHQLGEFNEALAAYNNAINLNRELGEAYLYRAAIKIKMQGNRKKGACSDFRTARELGVKGAGSAIKKYCK